MEPTRKHDQIARFLRADTPRVTVDDRFIAVLADLARASTPASERSRVGKTALRVRIAAATASVALVLVGAAYAAERFGGADQVPVRPTNTVGPVGPSEPANPGEPDERFEEPDEDIAPHNLDEGHDHTPRSRAGSGGQVDPGVQGGGFEVNTPQSPAPSRPAGQGPVAPDASDPDVNGSSGSSAPGANTDPADDADPSPEVDPDDREIEADGPGNAERSKTPDAELNSDPEDAG